MKIFVKFCDVSMIDTYYKQNGMYQTTIKYMKMFKESGRFTMPYRWSKSISREDELMAKIILFHYDDKDDLDNEIAREYHRFNNEYARLPYDTDKDVALSVVDGSRVGEVSFIFHESGAGVYDEIRYVGRNVNTSNGYSILDEI